jgi:hypothetical protein
MMQILLPATLLHVALVALPLMSSDTLAVTFWLFHPHAPHAQGPKECDIASKTLSNRERDRQEAESLNVLARGGILPKVQNCFSRCRKSKPLIASMSLLRARVIPLFTGVSSGG